MKKTNDELTRKIHQHNQNGISLLDDANEIHRTHQSHHQNSHLTAEETKQVGDKTSEASIEFHAASELQSELIKNQSKTIHQELLDLLQV